MIIILIYRWNRASNFDSSSFMNNSYIQYRRLLKKQGDRKPITSNMENYVISSSEGSYSYEFTNVEIDEDITKTYVIIVNQ